MLPVFQLDKMEILREREICVEKPLVAVYEEISSDDYGMILNPDVL